MPLLNYPRRQQYRRLSRAAATAMASAAAVMVALTAASAGAVSAAGVLLMIALAFGLYAHHWLSLAGRSRVGARSEDEVRHALAPLQADGWRLRHSLPWRGRGDIDSLAIAPTGVAFAIETKTRAYDHRNLAQVREQAAWLSRRRRRWCRRGAVPVICVVRARGVQRLEQNVLVVSIDRLIPVLRTCSAGSVRPAASSTCADSSLVASASNERFAEATHSPNALTEFPQIRAERDARLVGLSIRASVS